jgi:predicted RNA-binding Zn ribbon-like protein
VERVADYFHAWRRNQASRQAAEWLEERTEARRAVAEAPAEIRDDVRRAIDTLLEGRDVDVEPALKELWNLLDDRPELRARFARLRVVADAVDFIKHRTDPQTKGV